jgi:drug/metabolite transporter (DMT)-like permease
MNSRVSQFGAVALALAAYTLWVLTDTSLKIAGASALPLFEMLAVVGAAMVALLLLQAVWRRNLHGLWPKVLGPQLLRAGLELANLIGVYIALRHLPLALFYILIFCSPIVTTLLAAALLGEPLEAKQMLAVVTGFAGVLLAVDPFGIAKRGDWTGYLACLVCVASFSTNVVWSRRMTQSETRESLAFCSACVMAVGGLAATAGRAAPLSGRVALVLVASGLCGVLGSLCFFAALKHASAATVSQYHYSQLLTGASIGYVFWHESVSPSMLAGAALIIGSGCYTAARSYRAG